MAKGNGRRYGETFKRETGVNANNLHGWIKKYSHQPEIKAAQTFSSPDTEIRALQKQLCDLEEENEILKKAMHYFATR
ncbi:transposase [Niallia sp. 03190]|uniref:transposase n=1 Tax=Niallia sp. 03190 TaxID=3458061 RepID=UPI0040444387